MSFVVPGKTRSTSARKRNAAGGILPPRTNGKSLVMHYSSVLFPSALNLNRFCQAHGLAIELARQPLARCRDVEGSTNLA